MRPRARAPVPGGFSWLSHPPCPPPARDPAAPPPSPQVTHLWGLLTQALQAASPRITAQVRGGYHVFEAHRIGRFYAADKYACFRMRGVEYCLDDSLATLGRRLAACGFYRVHRRELVNLTHVCQIQRQDRALVLQLHDGQRVRVSRRLGSQVLQALQGPGAELGLAPATA